MVPLLATHQVGLLSYCSLAKPGSQTKNKGLASQDYSYSLCRQIWLCLMAKISAHSSVSLLRSLSVRLNAWSLLGLTILVMQPFLTVVSVVPMHGTVAGLPGPEF